MISAALLFFVLTQQFRGKPLAVLRVLRREHRHPCASPRAWLTMPSSVTLPSALGREPPLCFCPLGIGHTEETAKPSFPEGKEGTAQAKASCGGLGCPPGILRRWQGRELMSAEVAAQVWWFAFLFFFFFLTSQELK